MGLKGVRENEAAGRVKAGLSRPSDKRCSEEQFYKKIQKLAQSRYLSTIPLTSHLSTLRDWHRVNKK